MNLDLMESQWTEQAQLNRDPWHLDWLRRYLWWIVAFTGFVILWGAYVRATGSGAGCGSHWPLCNGEIIPQSPQLKTWIEYVHRTTSGLSLVLILGASVWVFRCFPRGSFVRRMAGIASVSILLEALIGAGLVLFELVSQDQSLKRTVSIALHFSNTLVLLASIVLTAVSAGRGGTGWVWSKFKYRKAATFFVSCFFLLGMAGAITALGDTLFPSQSLLQGLKKDFSRSSHFLLQLRGFHPALAMLLVLPWLRWVLALTAQFSPEKRYLGGLLVGSVVLNLILGWVNLFLLAPIGIQIFHLAMAMMIWIFFILFLDEAAVQFQSE